MAEIKMLGEREFGCAPPVLDGNVVLMNKRGTKKFSYAKAEVEILTSGKVHRRYTAMRDVIQASDGAQVLPYFQDKEMFEHVPEGQDWKVIMVEQFRIAIPGKTIEVAGGEVDANDPRLGMAQELLEEARIKVDHRDIELVFAEYIQPSMMAARAFGGIVRIKQEQLPAELVGGEWAEGEYTVLVVHSLVDLLRKRDAGSVTLDLWGSRLLDEVAKKVGLLTKRY